MVDGNGASGGQGISQTADDMIVFPPLKENKPGVMEKNALPLLGIGVQVGSDRRYRDLTAFYLSLIGQ